MNLIGTKVKHKLFGEGKITKIDKINNRVTVQFSIGEKVFGYPFCFTNFLEIIDEKMKSEISIIINQEVQRREHEREIEEIKRHERAQAYEMERASKTSRSYPRQNIAFKCTYCNGGKSNSCIGFNGLCSDEQKKYNIFTKERTWCFAEENPCRMYLEGKITKTQLEEKYKQDNSSVCYESNLFRAWCYEAGYVVRGRNKGKPNTIRGVQTNCLCVLTTQKPKANKMQRYIFGVFIVIRSDEGDEMSAGKVMAHPKYRIALTDNEAEKMCFWNYHKNTRGKDPYKWGQGLFRYIDDTTALKILDDLKVLKQNTPDEKLVNEMAEYFCSVNKLKR
ncbi:MAG: hypothetical protein K2L12_02680 [Clostridia bacterium]|nr:hypothetical protein [Clostridia bacterium]